jgi:hypothetical protein
VLLTIAGITFTVSIAMFFLRTSGSPFVIADFIIPYLLFALPALFFISALAIVAEVFLGKRSILQYIVFVFLFGIIMANVTAARNNTVAVFMDPFGVRTMTHSIMDKVNSRYHTDVKEVNLGFTFNAKHAFKTFEWNGIKWTGIFLLSRLTWIFFASGIVYFSSFFFHRFDFRQRVSRKKKSGAAVFNAEMVKVSPTSINPALLPPVTADYSIFPFIKTELLLLIRKGPKWFWLVNGGLWISMLIAPLDVVHAYLLPVLLFLQVTRWSDLATKEKTNRLHYFTYSSYKPLQRMLPAQLLAGIIMSLMLTLPVLFRYLIISDFYSIINIINGAVLIVLLAVCLGILSGGKKLYEIVFFMLTYAVIEKIPPADYLGGMQHDSHLGIITIVLALNIFLVAVSFGVRSYQVRHL